mmetsp:Transcript_18273/g.52262  ORF Transcript_18273/g.52262 Transcript_18273/m.52262 type:complete len:229 (+) Transcript_18273:1102-1788(+)
MYTIDLNAVWIELRRTDIQRHVGGWRCVVARVLLSGFGRKSFLLRRWRGIHTLALGPAVNEAAGTVGALGHAALRHNLSTKAFLELLLNREVELRSLPSTTGIDLGGEVEIFRSADTIDVAAVQNALDIFAVFENRRVAAYDLAKLHWVALFPSGRRQKDPLLIILAYITQMTSDNGSAYGFGNPNVAYRADSSLLLASHKRYEISSARSSGAINTCACHTSGYVGIG